MKKRSYLAGYFKIRDSCLSASGSKNVRKVQTRPATFFGNRGKGLAWDCIWGMSRRCGIGLRREETSASQIVHPTRPLPMRRPIRVRSSRAHCRSSVLKNDRFTCSCQVSADEDQPQGCGSISSHLRCPGVLSDCWRAQLGWRLPSLHISSWLSAVTFKILPLLDAISVVAFLSQMRVEVTPGLEIPSLLQRT